MNSGGGARIGAQWRSFRAACLDASGDFTALAAGQVGAYVRREFRGGTLSDPSCNLAGVEHVGDRTLARAEQGAKKAALAAPALVAWPEPSAFIVGAPFPESATTGGRTHRRRRRRRSRAPHCARPCRLAAPLAFGARGRLAPPPGRHLARALPVAFGASASAGAGAGARSAFGARTENSSARRSTP